MEEQPVILIVSKDPSVAGTVSSILHDEGVRTSSVPSAAAALAALARDSSDAVIADIGVSGKDFGEFLASVGRAHPDLAVLALVPHAEMASGMQAIRDGAADFLGYPVERAELMHVLNKTLKVAAGLAEAPPSPPALAPETTMLGSSPAMMRLRQTLNLVANGVATVLIHGESGSGKELVARQLHELSPRRAGPFVKVHCAALPDNLLESELFGYEKGAFTGAHARKPGRVEIAEGGTLFLDEIGDVTPAVQVKLLRLLQDRQYERLGSTSTLKADVRFVTATHRDLSGMVKKGEYREDLYYRLNVVGLWVPPLRARPDDLEELCLHFCVTVAEANRRPHVALDFDALELLKGHHWPGNVRELQNFIERLVVLSDAPRISAEDVRRELGRQAGTLGFATASGYLPDSTASSVIELSLALKKAERKAVEKALKSTHGHRDAAARLLGISRRALYYKLQEHELS